MANQIRRPVSVRQLNLLMDFLESHRDLALGRIRSKEFRALSKRLWEECAVALNATGDHFRTPTEWSKYWNDFKCRIKQKMRDIARHRSGTGGGPASTIVLSPLEERAAAIIGNDAACQIPGVSIDPLQSQEISAPLETAESDQQMIEILVYDDGSEDVVPPPSPLLPPPPPPSMGGGPPPPPPPPSTGGGAPPPPATPPPATPPPATPQQRTRPRVRRNRTRPSVSALDESRAVILRIEERKIEMAQKKITLQERKMALQERKLALQERLVMVVEDGVATVKRFIEDKRNE